MTALPKLKTNQLSHDDYFAIEQTENQRYEYLNGEIFAMAGGTERHALISSNALIAIGNALRNHPCRIYGSDMKLHIAAWNKFCYPDIQVLCTDSRRYEKYVEGPILIMEVLSATTESYDRGMKFEHYRAIPELRHYLLLSQNRPHAEIFTRHENQQWLFNETNNIDTTIHLPNLKIYLPLAEIYRNTEIQ